MQYNQFNRQVRVHLRDDQGDPEGNIDLRKTEGARSDRDRSSGIVVEEVMRATHTKEGFYALGR
jgi:hypothetical protein